MRYREVGQYWINIKGYLVYEVECGRVKIGRFGWAVKGRMILGDFNRWKSS